MNDSTKIAICASAFVILGLIMLEMRLQEIEWEKHLKVMLSYQRTNIY